MSPTVDAKCQYLCKLNVAQATVLYLKYESGLFGRRAEFGVTCTGDKHSGTAVCVCVAAVKILRFGR